MTHPWFVYIKQSIYTKKKITDKIQEPKKQNSLIKGIKVSNTHVKTINLVMA